MGPERAWAKPSSTAVKQMPTRPRWARATSPGSVQTTWPMNASAFVGVLNAFDATYNASVVINAFGRRYYEPAPGRSLYGGLSLGFGRR